MDYDFSELCSSQLERISKRLEYANKAFVREYLLALSVINNAKANEHKSETMQAVETLLYDQVVKCELLYTETLNKVQRALVAHV